MATFDYIVKITDNSSGTVTLTSSPFQIRQPELKSGEREESETENILEVRLQDGSVANNLDELRTLNNLLRKAYKRNQKYNKSINPVYVTWQESSGGTVWRSEIVSARADWLTDALTYGYWKGDTQFASTRIKRRNYWEGPEAQLALSNGNGTTTLSALTVYNHDDGTAGHDNYVEIAGTAVGGDLAGATRLELTNTTTESGSGVHVVWMGQNYTDTTLDHVLEAEDATGGTIIAGATSSGGSYVDINLTSTSTEVTLLTWTLAAADMEKYAGRYFKAILRFANTSVGWTSVRFRLVLQYQNSNIWQGSLVALDTSTAFTLRDLGIIKLPPWLDGQSDLAALNLLLKGTQTTGGTVTLHLDYLHLMPVDGWRYLDAIGYYVPENSRIIDDGINDIVYMDNGSGTAKVGLFVPYGRPFLLEPATTQRLYFLQNAASGVSGADSAITRSFAVKLYYRPRRLSL